MLLAEEVEVSWYYKTKEWYESKGYKFTKYGDKFIVPIKHLYPNSAVRIELICDYCGENFTRRYIDHIKIQNNHIGKKDACANCGTKKTKETLKDLYNVETPFSLESIRKKSKETLKENYGVENPFQSEEVKEKIKQTNLEKYGAEHYTQTDEYKNKTIETNLKKYGVDNTAKNDKIKEKIRQIQIEKYGDLYVRTDEFKEQYKNICQEKYGVDNIFQTEEVKEKIIEHNISKYGVCHPMQREDIKQDRIEKMLKTKYKNNNGQSSRQQDYLHKIIGGKINYPIDYCMLDIVFIEDMIYVEYDGSGHELTVAFGDLTQEEFDKKEIKRKYYLKSKGWQEIRIISKKDYLPSDEKIKEIFNIGKNYLKSGHTWIKFDIDNKKVITSQFEKEYDFGDLRKIKEQDLQEVV